MKTLIVIASLLLSLGSSGWFIWTYYSRDTEYRRLLEEENALSEEKSDLTKKLEKDRQTVEQSNSLESIRTKTEYLRQQLSRLDDERRNILDSGERLRRLEEREASLRQELGK
jgi:vacuolar-type H+-ATPase subunit I/STV1